MKKLEFKTAKCEFILVDKNDITDDEYQALLYFKKVYLLSHITEEEAREIVDLKGDRFQDYDHVSCCDRWCNTAIKSLHSLIKSKGVHLYENPNDNQCGTCEYQETESKTFYNPILFIKSK